MKTNKKESLFWWILFSAIIAFSYYKMCLGIHSDEVYLISLGDMIAKGNCLFRDCWSSLQTGGIFTAPIIWVYIQIHGNAEGILLFFRIVSLLIKLFISLYFYVTFINKYRRGTVFLSMIIYYTYVADFQSLVYKQELIDVSMLLIILLYRYMDKNKQYYVIIMAMLISAIVLIYPTSILLFIYILILLTWHNKKSKKNNISHIISPSLILITTCLLCCILFLSYVLYGIGFSDFLVNLPLIFKDENLNMNFIQKLVHPLGKLLVFASLAIAPLEIYKRIYTKKALNRNIIIGLCSGLIFLAYLGQTYIEYPSITWHCITYAYILTTFLFPYLYLTDQKRSCEKEIIVLWEGISLIVDFCMIVASNQGNITGLYGSVFAAIGFVLFLDSYPQNNTRFNTTSLFLKTIIMIIITSSYLLIYEQEAVEPYQQQTSSVFTKRETIMRGPAKGIRLQRISYIHYNSMYDVVQEQTEKTDRLFIVDSNFYAPYGYLMNNGNYGVFSPQGGGLLQSNRAISFYNVNKTMEPSVIIISKEYIDMGYSNFINTTEIGQYIAFRYKLTKEDENYYVCRKK